MPEDDARLEIPPAPEIRDATASDIEAIASLHADSWRRHYRGAYSGSFLDSDVVADRQAVWAQRLTCPRADQYTIVAVLGDLVVGFLHMDLDHDPAWGALVDNLHVASGQKRHGIGTRLLVEAARVLVERGPGGGFYLWVLDQNKAAQAFYAALGGERVESMVCGPFPGGGSALGHRMAWRDSARALAHLSGRALGAAGGCGLE
jgi:ribosomal protein S18 acetylase RimI-like enzyme